MTNFSHSEYDKLFGNYLQPNKEWPHKLTKTELYNKMQINRAIIKYSYSAEIMFG